MGSKIRKVVLLLLTLFVFEGCCATKTTTVTISTSLPTRTVTHSRSVTKSFSAHSLTETVSLSVPTHTSTLTSSLSETASGTITLSIPTVSNSLTYSETVSLSLPTDSSTESMSSSISPTVSESLSVSISQSESLTVSLSLPTISGSDSNTFTGSATVSATVSLSIPTKSISLTISLSLPTATRTFSLSLPTATETGTATFSITETASLSLTDSISLSETFSLSKTFSESLTDTFSVSGTETLSVSETLSQTIESADNYTGQILPSSNFKEGQEIRFAIQMLLGSHVQQAYFNYSDQSGFEFRLYESVDGNVDCANYSLYSDKVIYEGNGFGISHAEYQRGNVTFVDAAFVTVTAPHHSRLFIVCHRLTRVAADGINKNFPNDGKWILFSDDVGQYLFRSNPSELNYMFPEWPPGRNQFVVMRLSNNENWNFSIPVNCSLESQNNFERDVNYSWPCLSADVLKIVPKGFSCTTEPFIDRSPHPYFGSYFVDPTSGAFHRDAVLGLFEGVPAGGAGILSSPHHNPLVSQSEDFFIPSDGDIPSNDKYEQQEHRYRRVSYVKSGFVYIQIPSQLGEFEICFSSLIERIRIMSEKVPILNYKYKHDIPMWRKLYPCKDNNCKSGATLKRDMSFTVIEEKLSWYGLDFTPLTWGSIRVTVTDQNSVNPVMKHPKQQLLLDRSPVITSHSDNFFTTGGDWIRLVPGKRFLHKELGMLKKPNPPIGTGTFSSRGCWFDNIIDSDRSEDGVYSSTSSQDLIDNPFVSTTDRLDDEQSVTDTYAILRIPQQSETWFVCYRPSQWSAWHLLPFTDITKLPEMWLPHKQYPFRLIDQPTPLIPGLYESIFTLDYMNVSVSWSTNDTRQGMWGPLKVSQNEQQQLQNGFLSAKKNTAVRDVWQWLGHRLVGIRGSAIRITKLGIPCSCNANETHNSHLWTEYSDAGTDECHWESLQTHEEACQGGDSESNLNSDINFFMTNPEVGEYQICFRRGAGNWKRIGPSVLQTTSRPQFNAVAQLAYGQESAVVITSVPDIAVGHGGDYAKITYMDNSPCDLRPSTWKTERYNHDTVLSLLCSNSPTVRTLPCIDLYYKKDSDGRNVGADGRHRPLRDKNPYLSGIHDNIVAYFPINMSLPKPNERIYPKICVKSSLTTHWFSNQLSDVDFGIANYTISPPPRNQTKLVAGTMQTFVVVVDTYLYVYPVQIKLVRDGGPEEANFCFNEPHGADDSPFSLSQSTIINFDNEEEFNTNPDKFILEKKKMRLSFSLEIPTREGRYWMCIISNTTNSWKRLSYNVVDHGIRWHVKDNETPVNHGVSSIWLNRCSGYGCLLDEVIDTNPHGDSAKLVYWNSSCEEGIHIGLEGGGRIGNTDLGPSDGPQKTASFVVIFPETPQDLPMTYKVCLKTKVKNSTLHSSAVWISVPQDSGIPDMRKGLVGLETEPAVILSFFIHPKLSPLDQSIQQVTSSVFPTALAGALTTFIDGVEGKDAKLMSGFWISKAVDGMTTITDKAFNTEVKVSDISFKLVYWPVCVGLDPVTCQRNTWCVLRLGECEDIPGAIDCRAEGHSSSIVPSVDCVQSQGSCPEFSEEEMAGGDSRYSFPVRFHLPEAGRYQVCIKRLNSPWRWILPKVIITIDPLVQVDPGTVSVESPGSNVTVYDLHGVGGNPSASWCGTKSSDTPFCGHHYYPSLRTDWVIVTNDTQVCTPTLTPAQDGWFPLKKISSTTAAVSEEFALGGMFKIPPSDQTPSGQYRICILKVTYARQGSGNVPQAGAIAQAGVSYSAWNRAPPSQGTGGSTLYVSVGTVDGLGFVVLKDGVPIDTKGKFYSWPVSGSVSQISARREYESLQSGSLSKSVEIAAGDIITIKISVRSQGQSVGIGAVPIKIKQCEPALNYDMLSCSKKTTTDVFSYINNPPADGCKLSMAGHFGWDPSGGTQFLQNGVLEYNIQYVSSCPETDFNAGCGLIFISEQLNITSDPIWFSVVKHIPDGIIINKIPYFKTHKLSCWVSNPCNINILATRFGQREYAPLGNLSIGDHKNVSWGIGGEYDYKFTTTTQGDSLLYVSIWDYNFTILIQSSVLKMVSVVVNDILPLDVYFGLNTNTPPVPCFKSLNDIQDGDHIVAMLPYRLRFSPLSHLNTTTRIVNGTVWTAELFFDKAGGITIGRNRILKVSPNTTSETVEITTSQYTKDFEEVVLSDFTVDFRIYNNIECSRRFHCVVVLRLRQYATHDNGVISSMTPDSVHDTKITLSVRVKATTLRIQTASTNTAAVHEGIKIMVTPGSYDSDNTWLPDEYNEGQVYPLITDSDDGIVSYSGMRLVDSSLHNFEWSSLTEGATAPQWGAVWSLKTTQPCLDCEVTIHSTTGLGPTVDAPGFKFSLVDSTESVVCSTSVVSFSPGTSATQEFSITVVAATRTGVPTMWPSWGVHLNPYFDLLQDGGSVITGFLTLKQRDSQSFKSEGLITTTMEKGVAIIPRLYITMPAGHSITESKKVRIHVTRDDGSTLQCSSRITFVPTGHQTGVRLIKVTRLDEGRYKPRNTSPTGTEVLMTTSESETRLLIKYYEGQSSDSLSTDLQNRNIVFKLNGKMLKQTCTTLTGSCTFTEQVIQSSYPPIPTTENDITLGQGSIVLLLTLHLTQGWSAPNGIGYITLKQVYVRGFATPVRHADFEICDKQTIEGDLTSTSVAVPCEVIHLSVIPDPDIYVSYKLAIISLVAYQNGNIIEKDGPLSLRHGAPDCGDHPTKVSLSAAVFYIWGGVRYLVYDFTNITLSLTHTSDSQLFASINNPQQRLSAVIEKATSPVVDFTVWGMVPVETMGSFLVSLTPDSRIEAIAGESTRQVNWPAESGDIFSNVLVLDAAVDDDLCPSKRKFPRAVEHYKTWEANPGRGWAYWSDKSPLVGLPFPIQIQVQRVPEGRGWSFPESLVTLRSKVATRGCNDGGEVTIFSLRETHPEDSSDDSLPGNLDSFIKSKTNSVITTGGQATVWVSLSEPCQECVLQFDVCFQAASSFGIESCLSAGASQQESSSGPMIGLRTVTTKPFAVRPLQPHDAAITKQILPESDIIKVGIPLTLWVEPVFRLDGDWMFDIPTVYKEQTKTVRVLGRLSVKWVDKKTNIALRYGNGGFLKTSINPYDMDRLECDVSRSDLLNSQNFSSEFLVLNRYHTIAEIGPWMSLPLTAVFTRPCSLCEVWIEVVVESNSQIVSHWSTPIRRLSHGNEVPGPPIQFHVNTCSTRWIFGGFLPKIVQSLKPFTVAVQSADQNGIPSWKGDGLPVLIKSISSNTSTNGAGGLFKVTSPVQSRIPYPQVDSAEGGATFRIVVSRSCFNCSYEIAGLIFHISIQTTPTRMILSPVVSKYQSHFGGGANSLSNIWVFKAYLADDLGDRSYTAGPTFIQYINKYQHRLVHPKTLSILGSNVMGVSESVKLIHPDGMPAVSIIMASYEPTSVVTYGNYIQNGIPVDFSTENTTKQCELYCGLPGYIALRLQGPPTTEYQLTHVVVDNIKLPISLLGSLKKPILRWGAPPSLAIFNDSTAMTTYAGNIVNIVVLSVGGLPGTNNRDYPKNITYYTSIVTNKGRSITIRCDVPGYWSANNVVRQWNEPFFFDILGGSSSIDILPNLLSNSATASCIVSIGEQQMQPGSYPPYHSLDVIPPQSRGLTIHPNLEDVPDTWLWHSHPLNKHSAINFNTMRVVVGQPFTLRLAGYPLNVGRKCYFWQKTASGGIEPVLTPPGCLDIQIQESNTTMLLNNNIPVIQWTAVAVSQGRCSVQTVSGLPSGPSGSVTVSPLSIESDDEGFIKLIDIQGVELAEQLDPTSETISSLRTYISTGEEILFVLKVLSVSSGIVTLGDFHSSVVIKSVRCLLCCKSVHERGCEESYQQLLIEDHPIPDITTSATGGLISIPLQLNTSTQPKPSSLEEAKFVRHIPWVFTLYRIDNQKELIPIAKLSPLYVHVEAHFIRADVRLGDGLHRLESFEETTEFQGVNKQVSSQTSPVYWVVGFPFTILVTAIDSVSPPNIPSSELKQRGSDAIVFIQPLDIPCNNIDTLDYQWCSSCRTDGVWESSSSFLSNTCSSIPQGRCLDKPIPTCALNNWKLSDSDIARGVQLSNGSREIPLCIFSGEPGIQRLMFSSDSILESDEVTRQPSPYVLVTAITIQKINELRMEGTFIGTCGSVLNKLTVCSIVDYPFVSPPPVEPQKDENEVWFTPDRGLMSLQPADEDFTSTLDLIITTADGTGQIVVGDVYSKIALQFSCNDKSFSRRDRFYMGIVNTDPLAKPIISKAPNNTLIETVVNGKAVFKRLGFHGYCTHVTLFATCVTSPSIDTSGLCSGLRTEMELFEVGHISFLLDAPSVPPQPDSPVYLFPAVQILLPHMSCQDFMLIKLRFARMLRTSVAALVTVVLEDVVIHAACTIPFGRFDHGILGSDYTRTDICCQGYSTNNFPDQEATPQETTKSATLLVGDSPLFVDTSPAATQSKLVLTSALAVPVCPDVTSVVAKYFIDAEDMFEIPTAQSPTNLIACCVDGTCLSAHPLTGECFPRDVDIVTAGDYCSNIDKSMHLCTSEEIELCCGDPCNANTDLLTWITSPGSVWESISSDTNTSIMNCVVTQSSPMVPASQMGVDLIHINGTTVGCLSLCCHYGLSYCYGFSRSLHVQDNEYSDCWLKKPHNPSDRSFSTSYVLFTVDDKQPKTPVPGDNSVPCKYEQEISDCEIKHQCVWTDSNGCVEAVFCEENYKVFNESCVLCEAGQFRTSGDEIHGGDTICLACDGSTDYNITTDGCGICGGDDSTCSGCDGVVYSEAVLNPCGVCSSVLECNTCAAVPTTPLTTRVIRGPDWKYSIQDGHGSGTIIGSSSCVGGVWFTVRWDPVYDPVLSKYINKVDAYRSGCDGFYDLSITSCVASLCPFRDCTSASNTNRSNCESLGCSYDLSQHLCYGEPSADVTCPCHAWSKSDCSLLNQCLWMGSSCSSRNATCSVDHRVLNHTCVPCPHFTTLPAGSDPKGPDSQCYGCDGILGSNVIKDICGVCNGTGQTCLGCDGIPNSNKSIDKCGICGGNDDCMSCVLTPEKAHSGVRVRPGVDWSFGQLVGTAGGWLKEQKEACEGGHWWTVLWENGITSWYKVGCQGLYDLSLESCNEEVCIKSEICTNHTLLECQSDSNCEVNSEMKCIPTKSISCSCSQVRTECQGTAGCSWYFGACNVDYCYGMEKCPSDQCNHPGECDRKSGICLPMVPKLDGIPCTDNNNNTLGDRCVNGTCLPLELCEDRSEELQRIVENSGLSGYSPGMSCSDAYQKLNLNCQTSNWPLGTFSSACCFTCYLISINTPQVSSRKLQQTISSEVTTTPNPFIVEVELVLNTAVHPNPSAESQIMFDALQQSFESVHSPVCKSFRDMCRELLIFCARNPVYTSTATCPLVNTMAPVPIPKKTPVPVVQGTPTPPRRPDPLTPEELAEISVMWNPSLIMSLLVIAFVVVFF